VHGLFRNGPLDAGGLRYQARATFARSLPFRSTHSPGTLLIHLRDAEEECPRPATEPPASPRVPGKRSRSVAVPLFGGGCFFFSSCRRCLRRQAAQGCPASSSFPTP